MDPTHFRALRAALSAAEGASYLIEDGVELLEADDSANAFIVAGLKGQLEELARQLEIATEAARSMLPRLPRQKAIKALVVGLAKEAGREVPKADLPALVRAYEAESTAAEPHTAAGVVLDRAMRRMKTEGAAA